MVDDDYSDKYMYYVMIKKELIIMKKISFILALMATFGQNVDAMNNQEQNQFTFDGCTHLIMLDIPDSVVHIDEAFRINDHQSNIADEAFRSAPFIIDERIDVNLPIDATILDNEPFNGALNN